MQTNNVDPDIYSRLAVEKLMQISCYMDLNKNYMSRDMRFPTMWFVQPAKAQTSQRNAQSDRRLC